MQVVEVLLKPQVLLQRYLNTWLGQNWQGHRFILQDIHLCVFFVWERSPLHLTSCLEVKNLCVCFTKPLFVHLFCSFDFMSFFLHISIRLHPAFCGLFALYVFVYLLVVNLFVCKFVGVFVIVYLSLYLFVSLFICLFVYLSLFLLFRLSICSTFYSFICLVLICLFLSLFFSLFFFCHVWEFIGVFVCLFIELIFLGLLAHLYFCFTLPSTFGC